nr:immunoglobulin heavy chain junction region [Mus musculus]MBK4197921.1 immunoglobulin heavy chain junction region [Mus musculus]
CTRVAYYSNYWFAYW